MTTYRPQWVGNTVRLEAPSPAGYGYLLLLISFCWPGGDSLVDLYASSITTEGARGARSRNVGASAHSGGHLHRQREPARQPGDGIGLTRHVQGPSCPKEEAWLVAALPL